jgi:tRNA threonylcarbamoyl adenosine modification protein (Sua5/YciO/YrdC/YwlC family)
MLLKLYEENTNAKEVQRIADILRNGGLIIYPTDTVYAMGCDIFNSKGVQQICEFKKMDTRKVNLSFICYDLSHISEYAKIEDDVFRLMKKNLPGPFTFILQGNNRLPKLFKEKKTVGIRVPDNAIIRAIVQELGNPILSTSLPEHDMIEYSTDPELMHEEYGNMVDIVIDGGYGGFELSTIVDCTSGETIITRQGKGELTV